MICVNVNFWTMIQSFSLTQFKSKQEWRFTFTDRLLLIFTSLSLIVLALRLVSKFKSSLFWLRPVTKLFVSSKVLK